MSSTQFFEITIHPHTERGMFADRLAEMGGQIIEIPSSDRWTLHIVPENDIATRQIEDYLTRRSSLFNAAVQKFTLVTVPGPKPADMAAMIQKVRPSPGVI